MRLAARPRAIRGASSRRKRVIRDRVPAAKHCCEIAGEPTSGIDYAVLNVAHRENGKTTWRDASATIRSRWEIMNPPMPRCSEDIVALADVITTHALFARKVQRKLSNGVAGFGPGGSSLDRKSV